MSKYIAWLKRILTPELVRFVAGILSGLILRALFEKIIPLNEAVLFLFIIILIIFAVSTIARIDLNIEKQIPYPKFSAKVLYITQKKEGEAALYNLLSETIRSAKKSVYVISIARQSELKATPHRTRYYKEINKVLESKHRKKEKFRFERIVQVKEVRGEILEPDQMDPVIYEHCQLLLRLDQANSSIRVRLRQLQEGISPIAIFIVDNEQVVFLIPHISTNKDNKSQVLMGTGIFLSDPEELLVNELMPLFEDLLVEAKDVKALAPRM
jgi:hypothetical protein